jgi:Ribosomal protein S7p/S5e
MRPYILKYTKYICNRICMNWLLLICFIQIQRLKFIAYIFPNMYQSEHTTLSHYQHWLFERLGIPKTPKKGPFLHIYYKHSLIVRNRLVIRWLIEAPQKCLGKSMISQLRSELIDVASKKRGYVIRRKEQTE